MTGLNKERKNLPKKGGGKNKGTRMKKMKGKKNTQLNRH